jgi:hypothetical protein
LKIEDNEAINKLAAQIAEKIPQEDIAKIRANLDNITMQQREIVSQRGVNPLPYFFRHLAAEILSPEDDRNGCGLQR